MKIGFLSNQLDNRGTGNALFHYAYFNKTLLGNESAIYTFPTESHNEEAFRNFSRVFGGVSIITGPQDIKNMDAVYHIKSGENDGFSTRSNGLDVPYLVHCVFDGSKPHGDKYATISEWMASRFSIPYVPHIVQLPDIEETLRESLGIPEDATVFGRHGGRDTFDIPWAWTAINRALEARPDYYFLFMNTAVPEVDFYDPKRVIFMGATVHPYYKRIFINTCDAMIHARQRGETFGIAVGEFAICSKPVFTYFDSPEKAHIQELGNWGIYYSDEESLFAQLLAFDRTEKQPMLYSAFTPENVMAQFKEVFLD